MKIGISLLNAGRRRTGVENVALNLIAQLGKMDGDDEYVIYANTCSLQWLSSMQGRIRVVYVRPAGDRARWMWEHLFFLTSSRLKDVDVVHFPMGGGVVGYGGKFILTIHDLKHYLNKDLVIPRRHLLWRLWCKANVKRATRIITVSEHVKNDILREFPISADSIRVIYNGVDQRFTPASHNHIFKMKYQLPERYVLLVSTTSCNKNIRRAIDAMSIVRVRYGIDHQLIVAGSPGEDDAVLKKYVCDNNVQDRVRFIGYVDNDDLPQFYANADLFVFPSLTEGFGIPPLEAMRSAIPVVAARASCLPEILGDAPIWVDPLSAESIAEGIRIGLLDLGARKRAIATGLSRVKHFSWENMALATIEVYREAVAS